MEQVYTVGQAAKLLGMSPATVRRLYDERIIKGWRIPGGGHRRIPRSEVERLQHPEDLPFSDLPDKE
jgi:excisionase family DNA binding protein